MKRLDGCRVLVAEDEPLVAMLLEDALVPVTTTPRFPPKEVAGYRRPVTVLVSAEELIYDARPRFATVLWRERLLI